MAGVALIIIDVQQGLDEPGWGKRNNPDAESNIALLLQHWRQSNHPVIHVQHCSVEPNSPLRSDRPGNQFKAEAAPLDGEVIFQKTTNSAFIGTDLEAFLKAQGIDDLVIVGLTTDHCVSTSTRMAGNLGFNVKLVGDATATFDREGPDGSYFTAEQMHQVNLASLNGEFCTVVKTRELLEQ